MSLDAPGPYPEPPADLAKRALPLRVVEHPIWVRGHKRSRDPLYFNRSGGRFAAPDGELFGMRYLGEDEYAAFIESFSQGLGSTPLGLFISESLLHQSCLSLISTTRPMRLVDLSTGAALKRLAADADSRINDGPHAISQRWAAALWADPEQPNGLVYRTRNAPDHRAIARFDRVAGSIVTDCDTNLLTDSAAVARILEHFGCALIPWNKAREARNCAGAMVRASGGPCPCPCRGGGLRLGYGDYMIGRLSSCLGWRQVGQHFRSQHHKSLNVIHPWPLHGQLADSRRFGGLNLSNDLLRRKPRHEIGCT